MTGKIVRRRFKTEHERQLAQIAVARFQSEGKTQAEIADRMNFSQPEISRLVAEATKAGYVAPRHPRLFRENIPDEQWRKSEQLYRSDTKFQEKLDSWTPKDAKVRFTILHAKTKRDFCIEAAAHISELLFSAQNVGLNWGRTPSMLLDGFKAIRSEYQGAKVPQLRFVPLCGDPIFLLNTEKVFSSASVLAGNYGQSINADVRPSPSLHGVHAYISNKGNRRKVLMQHIRDLPGYRSIFGSGNHPKHEIPLARQLDMVITGMGTLDLDSRLEQDSKSGEFLKEILMQEDLSKEELDSIAFGEIGGVLIPRRNQKRRQLALYRYLAEGWTGINEEQLLRLAQTARERGTPGIVVLVFESDLKKAEFTCELLRRGFINHLVASAGLIEMLKQLP